MIEKLTLRGVFIWLICASFFMYEFFLRTVVGTFQHPIMHQLHLTTFSFALVSSTSYLLAYGVMQIPVGILSTKYGLKPVLLFAVLLCVLSVVGFAESHFVSSAVFFRFIMGLGSSFGFICLLVAVYEWLPRNYSGFFVGMSQFVGTLGPMLAAGPVEGLAQNDQFDWRTLFESLGIVGLVIALLVFFFVSNNYEKGEGGFRVLAVKEPVMKNVKRIYSQKQAWLIALYSACVYFSIEYLSETEGKVFLELRGYEGSYASYMLTVAWLAYAISCPLIGYLSDRFQRRKTLMVVTAFCCVIAIVGIAFSPVNKAMILISFVFLGIGASGQSLGFAIMAEQCRERYLAAGLGLNNGMVTTMVAINAPILGGILYFLGGHHPSVANYQVMFLVPLTLALIACVIVLFSINETFCKSVRAPHNLNY